MTDRKLLPEEPETSVDDVVEEPTEKEGDEITTEPVDVSKEEPTEKEEDKTEELPPDEEEKKEPELGNDNEEKDIPSEQTPQNETAVAGNDVEKDLDLEADGPIQSDKDFIAKPKAVEFGKLFEAGIVKPLEKVAGQKNLDDMVIEAIVQSMLATLYVFKEWAEQKVKNIEEAQKKTKENREKAIQEALKAHKTSYGKMAAYIAVKTDEFLRYNGPLYLDENGEHIPHTKWTKEQKKAYKKNKARYKLYHQKYKFAKKLKRIGADKDGPFDFTKLSRAEKRELNFYIKLYAVQNPTMKKYVEKMAEVQLHEDEYKQLSKLVNYVLVQRAAQIKDNQPKKVASQPLYAKQMEHTRVA